MKQKWFILLATGLFLLCMVGVGNAAIVNINSRTNSMSNPVNLFLEAGSYNVSSIGISDGGTYDAYNVWGSTSCTDPNGCPRTSPTTVRGWSNMYSVISSNIDYVEVNGSTLSPENLPWSGFGNYFNNGNYYIVDDGLVYPTALNALGGAQNSMFTLTTAGLVGFSITDLALGDNVGGISLNINAVPIPAAVWLLGSGLVGLVGLRRKMKE